MRKRHSSFAMRHAAGKRVAEDLRCPVCGRLAALTNKLDTDGNRICRWVESGRCKRPES